MPTKSLKNYFSYFSRVKFIRNVATLQMGTFTGSIIQAVIGIIVARLLQPELFGIYALALGMASMTTLIIGMGIQEAVSSMLGGAYALKNKNEIGSILGFMVKITFFAALFVIAVSFFLPTIANKIYGNSLVGIYAMIVVVGIVFSSLFFTLAYSSFQVIGKVKSLAALIVSDQSLRYGISLGLVIAGLGVAGAVGGQLVGALVVSALSVYLFGKIYKEEQLFPKLRELFFLARKANIKKYFNFTFWVALDRNMGNIYMTLPVILTGIYVTSSEVAFFKLAFGLVNLSLSLLGPVSILLNVEFPKMHQGERKRLAGNFLKVSFYSLGLSTLLTLGAVIASPFVFKFLYGEGFLPSIKYVFGLWVYGSLMGIGVGLGPMWRAVKKVKVSIIINSLILVGGIPLGLWLISRYGLWGSVIMVTIWFSVSHFVSFIYLVKKLKTEF